MTYVETENVGKLLKKEPKHFPLWVHSMGIWNDESIIIFYVQLHP